MNISSSTEEGEAEGGGEAEAEGGVEGPQASDAVSSALRTGRSIRSYFELVSNSFFWVYDVRNVLKKGKIRRARSAGRTPPQGDQYGFGALTPNPPRIGMAGVFRALVLGI